MKTQLLLSWFPAALFIAAASGCSDRAAPAYPDPYGLTRPKDFTAMRASSNNPDWDSNDDSARPIPGETTVLADLAGPRRR